jgi:hypothetical protein
MISYIRNKIHLYRFRRFVKKQQKDLLKMMKFKEEIFSYFDRRLDSFKKD